MRNKQEEIQKMILYCRQELLPRIKTIHDESICKDEKPPLELQILIKFALELYYSCFDYIALDIAQRCGSALSYDKIKFPFIKYIEKEEYTQTLLRLSKQIKDKMGIDAQKNQKLMSIFREFCSCYTYRNPWIENFIELRNENSHRKLSIYISKEDNDRVITTPSGGKLIFKGENSGVFDLSSNREILTASDLSDFFQQEVKKVDTKYFIFQNANPFSNGVLDLLETIDVKTERLQFEIYKIIT